MLAVWRSYMKIYPCGTPRTKHVITNPIVEIDEVADTATCRSYYTVVQATMSCRCRSSRPAAIMTPSNGWMAPGVSSYRDYSLLDLRGNLSGHLNASLLATLSP